MKKIEDKRLQWIREGYRLFSSQGVHGLNIELIAKNIGKNKSSFYHYFGTLDSFQESLLDYHLQQTVEAARRAHLCKEMKPDVLRLLEEMKLDIFFHKQLRINRSIPEFKSCFERAFMKIEEAIIDKWSANLGLHDKTLFAAAFLNFVVENFLFRITEDSFGYAWLEKYLDDVHAFIIQMKTYAKS